MEKIDDRYSSLENVLAAYAKDEEELVNTPLVSLASHIVEEGEGSDETTYRYEEEEGQLYEHLVALNAQVEPAME